MDVEATLCASWVVPLLQHHGIHFVQQIERSSKQGLALSTLTLRELMWLRPLPFLFSTLNEHSSSGTPHTPMRWHNGVIRGREFQSLSPSVIEIHEDYASYVGESRERIFALLQLLRDN